MASVKLRLSLFCCFMVGNIFFRMSQLGSSSGRVYSVNCCDICIKYVQIFVILRCFAFYFMFNLMSALRFECTTAADLSVTNAARNRST